MSLQWEERDWAALSLPVKPLTSSPTIQSSTSQHGPDFFWQARIIKFTNKNIFLFIQMWWCKSLSIVWGRWIAKSETSLGCITTFCLKTKNYFLACKKITFNYSILLLSRCQSIWRSHRTIGGPEELKCNFIKVAMTLLEQYKDLFREEF